MCVQLNWFTSCIKDRNAETNKILCCVTMVLMKHEVVKARSPHILKMAGNYRFEFVVVIMLCNVLNFFNNVSMFARAEDELCFSVIGDIGGLPRFPFQTTSQRKVAKLLAKVGWLLVSNNLSFNVIMDPPGESTQCPKVCWKIKTTLYNLSVALEFFILEQRILFERNKIQALNVRKFVEKRTALYILLVALELFILGLRILFETKRNSNLFATTLMRETLMRRNICKNLWRFCWSICTLKTMKTLYFFVQFAMKFILAAALLLFAKVYSKTKPEFKNLGNRHLHWWVI